MRLVVKAGGDLLKEGLPQELVNDLIALSNENQVILVHGGGDIVTEIATKLDHPPRFVVSPKGFKSRYTDFETSQIFTMVMAGRINKEIVSALEKGGVTAIGLTGLDAHLIKAKRKEKLIIVDDRNRKKLIDGGYTGKVQTVNASMIESLLEMGILLVVSPVAQGEKNEALNVDGDRVASAIASAINADRLVLLTDVKGLMLDNEYVAALTVSQANQAMEQIGPGMITKVYAAVESVKNGVGESIITSGFSESPIMGALGHIDCTVISDE